MITYLNTVRYKRNRLRTKERKKERKKEGSITTARLCIVE
jgi:hypothetical protein